MYQLLDESSSKVIGVRASGKITREDYQHLLPHLERAIEAWGSIRLLIVLEDIRGITPGAIWEDLKFDVRHLRHIERYAVVGDKAWEKGLVEVARPFVHAEGRFFEHGQEEQAWTWLKQDPTS